jgi:ketosteroid isomerase-like protein
MPANNQQLINKFFEAFAAQDHLAVRKVMHENVKWYFPGKHPMSGVKNGIDEVLAFFTSMGATMSLSNIKSERLISCENDNYLIECQHVWTDRKDGNNLDHHWCVLWTFEDGKILEGKHFAADQHAADAFFNKVFR